MCGFTTKRNFLATALPCCFKKPKFEQRLFNLYGRNLEVYLLINKVSFDSLFKKVLKKNDFTTKELRKIFELYEKVESLKSGNPSNRQNHDSLLRPPAPPNENSSNEERKELEEASYEESREELRVSELSRPDLPILPLRDQSTQVSLEF